MTQGDDPVLETRELSLHYGPVRALAEVDLRVPGRRITAVIGPSGCGKTTLLRCFNRMNDAYPKVRVSGRVFVEGVDVTTSEVDLESLRKRVGMVFQKSNPFPMSIRRNVTFGPRMSGVRDPARLAEIAEHSLRLADLWAEVSHRLDESALDLSGGQQQRLCIARALANEPDILLLDEPASSLDPISTAKIEDTLVRLKERYTIVIVTHNLQQAARVADFTAFLMAGRLVEFGATARMFTNPREKLSEDYITGRFG
ncbi:MAG: phosphate ABC transporter ATP-binding protein PstB [Thermoanaerobaculales bacterium]|jgi:phosphate transport system ATP-binding protein|nr:phosphate ABC transporter ATP-binding protein PstB [Thermoanaerobaculales bacterium]